MLVWNSSRILSGFVTQICEVCSHERCVKSPPPEVQQGHRSPAASSASASNETVMPFIKWPTESYGRDRLGNASGGSLFLMLRCCSLEEQINKQKQITQEGATHHG